MTIKTIRLQHERSTKANFEKINKKFKNNDVFYQISLHFIYKVHLSPGVYKLLSSMHFDKSSKN